MDGPTIQARVYAGYAKAANIIGLLHSLYRPISQTAPLANLVSTLMVAIDSSSSYTFKAPNEYGDPTWFALLNDATTQTGDYIVGTEGTYFVAGKQFLLPVIVIECNRVVSIMRITPPSGVGVVAYSGENTSAQVAVISGWPASILLGGRGEGSGTKIPSAGKNSGWKILLPPSVTVQILASDVIVDDEARRFVVQAAEFTDLGWRIQAVEEHS